MTNTCGPSALPQCSAHTGRPCALVPICSYFVATKPVSLRYPMASGVMVSHVPTGMSARDGSIGVDVTGAMVVVIGVVVVVMVVVVAAVVVDVVVGS